MHRMTETRGNGVEYSIVTIATNVYLDYWRTMVESAESNLDANGLQFVVFTDDPDAAHTFALQHPASQFSIVKVPPYRWPEATLYRYTVIAENADKILGATVAHVDADMTFRSRARLALGSDGTSAITLVKHPGFRRPRGNSRMRYYLASPLKLVTDAFNWLHIGSLGAWETNRRSLAYVPRRRRDTYVAGGFWWGPRDELIGMCRTLGERVTADESAGIIARWHDESHLNWYASTHPVSIADSEYCYADGYRNLLDIEPIVVATMKTVLTR